MRFIFVVLSVSAFLTFCSSNNVIAYANSQIDLSNEAVDDVPRDRLLSDAELVALIDEDILNELDISTPVSNEDLQSALKKLSQYFSERENVKYFFETKNLSEQVSDYLTKYPEEEARIKNDAYEFIDTYGSEVDWLIPGEDKLGRSHDPNTIRFLSRQRHAFDISLLYHIEDDPSYQKFLLDHMKDFASDYEEGLTQTGSNHIFERFYAGHRARRWLASYHMLVQSEDLEWQYQIFMVKVFFLHAARLYDSGKEFNWGNHQLVGLTGAYEISIMFPEFPVMRKWNERALEVIMEHLDREIEQDGFQFERASHYHKLDIINYIRVHRIATLNDVNLPELFYQRFPKMFDAIVALSMPEKALPIMHDVSTEHWVRRDEVDDVMSLGAILFENSEYKYFSAEKFPSAFYWLFDNQSIRNFEELNAVPPSVGSAELEDSKYYIMRSGWDEDDLYLLIDAGMAEEKPDHTHGGMLGVIGYAKGEQFLPNYPVTYRERSYQTLKNSLVKSVGLTDWILHGQKWVDNKARTGFGIWGEFPEPQVNQWLSGEKFDYFSGALINYGDENVEYSRSIFFFKPNFWIFVDHFQSKDRRTYQQIWQGQYEVDQASNSAIQKHGQSEFLIRQADPTYIDINTFSHYYTDSVVFEKTGEKDYRFATLVYPYSSDSDEEIEIRRYERSYDFSDSMGGPYYRKFLVTSGDNQGYLYFSDNYKIDVERVQSDAEFVALTYEGIELQSLFAHDSKELTTEVVTVEGNEAISYELFYTPEDEWKIQLLSGDEDKLISISWQDGTKQSINAIPGKVYDAK